MPIPRIVITLGEPAGIGPDICLLISQEEWPCELVFIADPSLLHRRADILGLPIKFETADTSTPPTPHAPCVMKVIPVELAQQEICGHLNAANASYVVKTLEIATQLCLDGVCNALVTGPVQKSIINEAGIPFTGHTEFLASYSDGNPVMMLATDKLKVALVTTHLPLKDVSIAITPALLEQTITTLVTDLKKQFGILMPKIAVCGLNPHSGENGHLGQEEITTIIPTLKKLRAKGINLTGPLPADTAFNTTIINEHDVILAMYHDQGLPTLKYSGFGNAVNITLGLPILRTSVDHGTALDLAGTGKATQSSLRSAVEMAISLSQKNVC
jgi:4-hydroxythreonine-4-phosphate dehydrogenase